MRGTVLLYGSRDGAFPPDDRRADRRRHQALGGLVNEPTPMGQEYVGIVEEVGGTKEIESQSGDFRATIRHTE